MKVSYRKKFIKQLEQVSSTTRSQVETFVFEYLPNTASIADLGIRGDDLLVIEDIPIIICRNYHEQYITAETLHQIEKQQTYESQGRYQERNRCRCEGDNRGDRRRV